MLAEPSIVIATSSPVALSESFLCISDILASPSPQPFCSLADTCRIYGSSPSFYRTRSSPLLPRPAASSPCITSGPSLCRTSSTFSGRCSCGGAIASARCDTSPWQASSCLSVQGLSSLIHRSRPGCLGESCLLAPERCALAPCSPSIFARKRLSPAYSAKRFCRYRQPSASGCGCALSSSPP